MAENLIRKHLNFYGIVQGVGFRYTAQYAASAYGVTGWVRNEYDGSVTLELQGSQEQIDMVIAAINRARYIRVDNMLSRSIALDHDERRFRVRY